MVIGLDSPIIDVSNPVILFVDLLDQAPFGNRVGFGVMWDGGSGLGHLDLATGVTAAATWDLDTTNLKTKALR